MKVRGFVLQVRSGHYQVVLDDGLVIDASARGRSKKKNQKKISPVIAGDEVELEHDGDKTWTIEKKFPRKTLIEREHQPGQSQSIVANVDHALVVFSANKPRSRFGAIDRHLVSAEYQNLDVTLVFNKWDLADEESEKMLSIYQKAGLNCLKTFGSSRPEEVLNQLTELDFKRLYVFGPSGVGKTTLINIILPKNVGRVGEVNPKSGRGRQTTTTIEFKPLGSDRYIVDTPGLSHFILHGIGSGNLKHFYHEFKELAENCKLGNCLHLEEPLCSVRESAGESLSMERYNSYLDFYAYLKRNEEKFRGLSTKRH